LELVTSWAYRIILQTEAAGLAAAAGGPAASACLYAQPAGNANF